MLKFSRKRAQAAQDFSAPLLSEKEIAELIEQVNDLHTQHRDVHRRHAGNFRSVYLGRGLDFEESRPYQRGDDLRDMDWRTTARSNKPYLKIYREEHQPGLHIVLDRSAGMRFGTIKQLKVTQGVRLSILFAFAAAKRGAAVSATMLEHNGFTLPATNGEAGAMQVLQAAITPCPPGSMQLGPSLHATLAALDNQLPRSTQFVIISDFSALEQPDADFLQQLATRHELLLMQILDPAEKNLPNVGYACFWDNKAGAALWINSNDAKVREQFKDQADAFFATQQKMLQRIGAPHFLCYSHEDAFDFLVNQGVM